MGRASMSAGPPGENGTIRRIGFDGYDGGDACANAALVKSALTIAHATTLRLIPDLPPREFRHSVTQSKRVTWRTRMASISRQLAQWITALRYDDLPPAVIDRAKGVTLHNVASM